MTDAPARREGAPEHFVVGNYEGGYMTLTMSLPSARVIGATLQRAPLPPDADAAGAVITVSEIISLTLDDIDEEAESGRTP